MVSPFCTKEASFATSFCFSAYQVPLFPFIVYSLPKSDIYSKKNDVSPRGYSLEQKPALLEIANPVIKVMGLRYIVQTSRKHVYIILTLLNPTFI